ncbi:unnamed protein product [Lampetra fluviatilis]
MSKYQKKQNPPVGIKTTCRAPGTAVPVTDPAVGRLAAPEAEETGAIFPQPQPKDGWHTVTEQLELLRATVLQLVVLMMVTAVAGRTARTSPERTEQAPSIGVLAGTSTGAAAAITRGTEDTWLAAAIMQRTGETWPGATIMQRAGETRPLELIATEGDWSAFTWRFEAAFRSVNSTEEEALNALPTALDDDALAALRAIPADKKATLQRAYAEIAVYKLPSDTRKKFLQWRRVEAEMPLT